MGSDGGVLKYVVPEYRYAYERRARAKESDRLRKKEKLVTAEKARVKQHNAGLGQGGEQPGVAAAMLTARNQYPGAGILK
jgi:hypothetical protein